MKVNPELEFYVYVHFRKDDGLPFYVGKGCDKRAWRVDGRNEHWNRIVSKHGLRVEIFKSLLSENEAFELEKSLILALGRGFLCNHTNGGEGVSGRIISPESRAKMALAQIGRKHSAKSKAKMGVSLKRQVYCSNGMKFDGVIDAEAWLKTEGFLKARQSVISRCASGLRKSAYGFSWSYFDRPTYDPLEIDAEKRLKQSAAKKGKVARNIRAVLRSDGIRFCSAKLAADFMRELGHMKASNSAICACCAGRKKTAYGYSWEYEKG